MLSWDSARAFRLASLMEAWGMYTTGGKHWRHRIRTTRMICTSTDVEDCCEVLTALLPLLLLHVVALATLTFVYISVCALHVKPSLLRTHRHPAHLFIVSVPICHPREIQTP